MTAVPEPHDIDEPRSGLPEGLKLAVAGGLALFGFGAAVGAGIAAAEHASAGRVGVAAAFLLAGAAAAVWFVRLLRRTGSGAPEAPRVARARRMLVLSGGLGAVLGLAMALAVTSTGETPGFEPFSDAPLPPAVAAALIAALVLVVAPVTWVWHRNIDEHESAAYRLAALLALYAYFAVSAIWWLGARGGFLPSPDGVAIFFVTVLSWGLAWAWARFR